MLIELTKEEKKDIDRQLNLLELELNFINEPTYKFDIGEKVVYGSMAESIVIDILYDYKVYVLKCKSITYKYDKEIIRDCLRVCAWTEVRPLGGDTNFATNDNISIEYTRSDVAGLLFRYYNFGVEMNPYYQRDYVWNIKDKENLIDSIFNNIDIGKFAFIKRSYSEDILYEILDGKQRLNALIEFYENKFTYKGYYYNDLSIKDRRAFKNFAISVGELKNLSKADILKCFIKLNTSGKVMDKEHIDKVINMLHKGE